MIGSRGCTGGGTEPHVGQVVAAVGGRGDRLAVEERADRRDGFVEPVEALSEPGAELDPGGLVLQVEPGPAEAPDCPPVTDVVEGGERLGDQGRVPERVRADQQPEARPAGDLRPGGERRVPLEDRLERVAEDRVQVVPRPEVVVAEVVHAPRACLELAPGRRLAPQQHAEPGIHA